MPPQSRPPAPFHGLIGSGMIGVDPFSPRSWSGISRHFFQECERQGLLDGASGAEVEGWRKLLLLAVRFHPDKAVWRLRYYLSPGYRNALTRALAPKVQAVPSQRALLQIGALFDAPSLSPPGGRFCCSYHDGNLAFRLRSPFGAKGLSEGLRRRALAYERHLYHRLDRIFTMSEHLRQSFISDFGVPGDRVVTVGAGVNLETLPEAAPDKDYVSGRILFIGTDFERKGGLVLLRAFHRVRRQFPHAELHVAGPKTSPPAGQPMAGVVWHGFLRKEVPEDSARLERLWRECTAFALPSLYEPFGIAPAEAMLHGMPAVVTGDWALGETVLHDRTGLHVKAGCEESLATALEELLSNPERCRQLGAAARIHAMEHFTWPKVVGRLKEALEAFSEPVR